jgi:hypothetical protein
MNLQLKFAKTALITLGLLCCFSFAQEPEAKALLSALDSIEENVIGFALNGQAKAGILSSTLSSEALKDEKPVSEYLAFTDFLLSISVRPSNETKATFDLRFHKDWQDAYREGNNSPIVRWWSYDGNILDKKLKFNLGTMRVAYTPLTIYLPEPNLVMEPEIFASLKKEVMEDRYLDGTNRRLLQGLNLEYGNSAGVFDNIFLQGTLVRLRKAAAAADRVSYDFDPNKDRFSAGARLGIETFGLYAGVNEVYTFNRLGSVTRVRTDEVPLDYEKNNVLSFELNYSSKKLSLGAVSFGAGAEYALSNWTHLRDTVKATEQIINTVRDQINLPSIVSGNVYPYYKTELSTTKAYEFNEISSLDGNALFANAFVAFDQKPFEAKLSGHFLNVNEDFEAELAASPAYLPNLPILNSAAEINSAFAQFRTGSLENMYYSLYYTLPLNAMTVLSGTQGDVAHILSSRNPIYQNNLLNNNYKLNQYYRNAYTQQTYTRLERTAESSRLDPAVNMALPYGYATPDRSGGGADLSFAWNKAVNLKAVFGKYSSEYSGDYTRFGGGLEVDIARLAGLGKTLTISGSFEQNKQEYEEFSPNPQVSRIMAGAKVGIWRGLYLIGGFQQLSSEFANPLQIVEGVNVNKTGETLITGGPQVKISEKAKLSLQCSLLSNFVEGNTDEGPVKLDLDKFIMSGVVEVEF